MRLMWRGALCALVATLLWAGHAAAQAPTGSVAGTVVDESSQVIPGATVSLVHEQTGAARSATSGADGTFAFNAVPQGTYTIRVELAGFRTLERRGNVVNAASHVTLGHLTLAVGTLNEVVTVQATGTKVETTQSDYTSLLTSKQIEQIQTRGRDVMNLLRLLPGVRYDNDIDAMGDSFGSLVPQVGGNRRQWNAVMVDGLLGNETSGTNRFSSALNLDAIEEVKVLLNTYKAEYGRSGGANIQIVSKSGGSGYKGSAYWFGRRDEWNANTWENIRSGLPKANVKIDTYGFNLGGPVRIPGLVNQQTEKKLFFFYSLEAPQVDRPGNLRRYLMPTAAERRGDFSQTRDANGALIPIRDPLTGQPFPGNIIPANRIDTNGQALLNYLPQPNDAGQVGRYNFLRQETSDNPRWNNFARLDWKRSANSTWFGTIRTFNSDQYGSEITAGPAKWGFFDASYIFSDSSLNGGWLRVFGPNVVNELSTGVKRQTEGFQTRDDSGFERLSASAAGFRGPSLFGLNTLGVLPQAQFGLGIGAANQAGSIDTPDFTYDQRLGNTAFDYVYSLRDTLTWVKGNHTFKAGGYFEFMQNREARGGVWMGQYNFARGGNNPIDTNHAFSNALLGVFQTYTESSNYRESFNRGTMAEWFAQDTWHMNRLTVDYGARFLFYTPWWRPDGRSANFRPELYNAARAPRLFQPAIVNGTRVALDPVTGQTLNAVYIGGFVPGTGDPANGMELGTDPNVPKSFRDTNAPQIEPRFGFAYDLTGDGRTSLHASAGVFHQARLGGGQLGNIAGNPPFIQNPIVNFGTIAGLASGTTQILRPANINAFERSSKTPSAYNWSFGMQRDIGWGTVVDVSYAGNVGRHLEMEENINAVPDGARFLDLNPQNRDPTNNAVLPPEFLRPYRGYQDIIVRGNWGTSDYHSLQIQANRRYIHGVQFGGSYTFSRGRGLGEEDPVRVSHLRNIREWNYDDLQSNQVHAAVINYTWDLPQTTGGNAIVRAVVNGWQVSGENAFVSGDWAQLLLTTVDNFDFTGGEGGQGQQLGGPGDQLRLVRPGLSGDPMANAERDPLNGWFDTSVVRRPSGRGDVGSSNRNPVQKPGIKNWNLAAFKNFTFASSKALQFRAEFYNVLNTLQFSDIDRTARFDAAGTQINPNFGKATTSRAPRNVQLSLRFTF
jgi:hypothetical protein